MRRNALLIFLAFALASTPSALANIAGTSAMTAPTPNKPTTPQATPNVSIIRTNPPATGNVLIPGSTPAPQGLSSPTPASLAIPSDLAKMTPEQTAALLNQAKDLKPEQLQAIAKSIQQKAPNQQEIENRGLIEETVTVSAAPAENLPSLQELKRDQAFNALMEEVLPMSPDQIMRLHKFYDLTLQAKATPPNPPPTPHTTSMIVNLDPGSQPPVIRLAAGFVTSILFVDATGEPWPLTAYSIGDPQNFNIQWDQKSNAIFVQSLKQYSHANLAVRLWGLNTPVMITLVSGQKNVDFRVDLQIGGRGPDAKVPIVETTFNAKVNPILINLLDGIPPRGSIKLGVSGGHGDAWLSDSRIYFRTKLTVLSPAWTATVTSPDGTHVYELMLTPYILASHNGKTIDIKLSGL